MKIKGTAVSIGIAIFFIAACSGAASVASPSIAPPTESPVSGLPTDAKINTINELFPVLQNILASTPSFTPTLPTVTPLPTPTLSPSWTPTLAADAWQSLPIVPSVSDTTRRIYEKGRALQNDPRAFSILGDCLSLPINLFGNYGKNASHYKLGEYASLQPVIDWFVESLDRVSISLGNGFNTSAVLSPLRADPERCESTESPMGCEYRIHHPSFALIALGTDDVGLPPETFEKQMREIIEYTISKGIVPILATKADNREGNYAFNRIIARLAHEYDIPLWNYWAAVQPLPGHGLVDGLGHLTWSNPNRFDYPNSMLFAIPVRTRTALQTLDAVWRGVTAP
jgi:hypothetical protein